MVSVPEKPLRNENLYCHKQLYFQNDIIIMIIIIIITTIIIIIIITYLFIFICGEWPSGLRFGNQNRAVPVPNHQGVRPGLGTQPLYETPGDPRDKNVKMQ